MALVTKNAVFLHIPKTGGVFVAHALSSCGVKFEQVGAQHERFPRLTELRPRSYFDDKLIFCFVRHPAKWYQSRWAFRMKNGWQMLHPLDYHCASNDFNTFVRNVLKFKPHGWCNHLFNDFAKPEGYDVRVGRNESLIDDLLSFMAEANQPLDEDLVRSLSWANDSALDGFGSGHWAVYEPDVLEDMLAAEKNVILEYYQDFALDRTKYIGEIPY